MAKVASLPRPLGKGAGHLSMPKKAEDQGGMTLLMVAMVTMLSMVKKVMIP